MSAATNPKKAPYGTWDTPITTVLITQSATKIDDTVIDPITSKIYLVEGRPNEDGRNVVVDIRSKKDIFGKDFNARTSVQEYGGSPVMVYDSKAYFSSLPDKNVYMVDLKNEGSQAVTITPDNPNSRYADFAPHPSNQHLLVSVLEDHTKPEPLEVQTRLAVLDAHQKTVTDLVTGADFYSSPTFSPDGTHIAWTQWFHPDMPWEGGEIALAPVSVENDNIQIKGTPKIVAGKRFSHCAQQPEWLDNSTLLYISDEVGGYLNPYSYSLSSGKSISLLKQPMKEDFGEPPWQFGNSSYAILTKDLLICSSIRAGISTLYTLSLSGDHKLTDLHTPYVEITHIRRLSSDSIIFTGKKTSEGDTLVKYTLSTNIYETLWETAPAAIKELPEAIISHAQPYSFPIPGSNNGDEVHVIFYPPTNPKYRGNDNEKPPCVVSIHGGPTSRTAAGLKLEKQLFTSRGFAWLDVNYGGSSGYGSKYINRLRGNWGVVDVSDTILAVSALADKGLIDIKRTAIRGGSAGGFTVLAALTTSPTFFSAGNSFFGVSELTALAKDTHKFEARYLERLVGGTPDEIPQVYKERSPLYKADKIKSPLLILQGSADFVVPPDQSRKMAKIIEENNGVVKYIEYEGEGHGWRKVETIRDAWEREIAWYKEVWGLTV